MPQLYGQCACGNVKFRFDIKELIAYQCHCSVCRKVSGSAYSATLMTPAQGFHWIEGKETISTYSRANGFKASFCSSCGSPVPNKFRDFPLYTVPLGSLENEPEIEVVAQIYMGSKAPWEKTQLTGELHDEMPSLDIMLAYLHVH